MWLPPSSVESLIFWLLLVLPHRAHGSMQDQLRCQQREQATMASLLDGTAVNGATCPVPQDVRGTQFPSLAWRAVGANGSLLPDAGRERGVCKSPWTERAPKQHSQSLRRWKTAFRKRMKTQGSRMGLKALKRKARRSPISLLSGAMAWVKPRI